MLTENFALFASDHDSRLTFQLPEWNRVPDTGRVEAKRSVNEYL
jgi:hypothetical protein